MVHTRVDPQHYEPQFFADTETAQFAPWPIHEQLAFGSDLIPTLVHSLEVTRRTKPSLQLLRSLEHVLSDPELCLQALSRNVLKALTTLLVKGDSVVKIWVLACLRVIAGNPHGKWSIANQRIIMTQICTFFASPEPEICEMIYSIVYRLSENWFVVPTLQKYNCIELVMKNLFIEVSQPTLHEKRIACLLETLVNLMDYKDGVQKAIRYDLFELTWLLVSGLQEVEEAMLRVFGRVATDEFGRLGIYYKGVGQLLFRNFHISVNEDTDPTLIGTVLALATLPNFERDEYRQMDAIEIVFQILQEPNLSKSSMLALVRLLTNLTEHPEGRRTAKGHLETLITTQIRDPYIRDAIELLITTTLSTENH